MAPRKGGGGDSDGGSGGVQLEETFQLYLPEEYRSSYNSNAIVNGVFAASFLILFITSIIIRQQKWKNANESAFVPSIITSTLFLFVAYALTFTSYFCALKEATVFESFMLMVPFGSTFYLLAELTFLAAVLHILHNRVRTVAAKMSSMAKVIPILNWFLYSVYLVLGLVWLGDSWAYNALQLKDLKQNYASMESWEFLESTFHVVHARRINASLIILRFVIQVVLIIQGGIALCKTPKGNVSVKARNATIIFVSGGLVPYTIAPLQAIIVTFKYWEPTSRYPLWLMHTQQSIEGAAHVITLVFLCIFMVMMGPVNSPGQWDLGTRKYSAGAAAAANSNVYYESVATDPVHKNTPGMEVVSTSYAGHGSTPYTGYDNAPYAGHNSTSYAGHNSTSYAGQGHGSTYYNSGDGKNTGQYGYN